jgi:hypothetical protein
VICKILKKSPEYVSSRTLDRQRHRAVQFPRLHDALYVWMKAVEKHTTITGPILCAKAKKLFPQLYPGEQMLKFSNGWLDGWKQEYGVKEYHQHGEAGSAPITEAEEQMQEIRRVLSEYELRNIFNADETGYYYRMQPERGLAMEQMAGKKKDKARLTVLVTANGDGSERYPLWIIGSALNPRCFKNVRADSLGCIYRANKKAWMRTDIMIEFLTDMNRRMIGQNRKIALLMDNFSAHKAAVEQLGGLTGLSNVRVVWLPENTTSHYQPDDQGIIRTLKAHVRNHFLAWQVDQLDTHGFDKPVPKVNVLQAIRWAVAGWNHDIKDSTIFNCFLKSTVKVYEPTQWADRGIQCSGIIDFAAPPDAVPEELEAPEELAEVEEEVAASYNYLRRHNWQSNDIMSISNFLNPVEEQIQDSPEDIEVGLLPTYLPTYAPTNTNRRTLLRLIRKHPWWRALLKMSNPRSPEFHCARLPSLWSGS